MGPPPVVTGLSPNEGPPGTRIKIRGEFFGAKPTDLVGLTICGIDCLLSAEWKSPNKIIAISGPVKGKGDVIVTTRSGGVGSCNVSFKGNNLTTIGPLKESAVWVEESVSYSWGRHALSPNIYQQEDPLGLSVEDSDKKMSEEDLSALFPNKNGEIASENFSAGWFLLDNHLGTSFNDIQAGLEHLRRKVKSQKEGQLSFLKANIGSVMDQVDTLVNLKEKYEKDLPVFGPEPTVKLERTIRESEREARKLFEDVLARRDRAERTRNALNVLARFKFLFCLPCVIDRNIKKAEYDIVINDYIRVKNLFMKTEVPIFQTALEEVEKRIKDLQIKLHSDLQTMPVSVEQQKRLIRYLVNLDSPFDPAWDAIKSRSDWINKKMKEIYKFYKMPDKSDQSKKTPTKLSKFSPSDLTPFSVLFTEEICAVISESFPDLWKIGQAYFSGELQVKVEVGRQIEFKHMVLGLIEGFCKSIRGVLIPNSLDKNDKANFGGLSLQEHEELTSFLPELLRSVRFTYSTLIKLDLPGEALDIVSNLLLDLKIHFMTVLFKQTVEQIKQLQENWKIDFSGQQSGITQLPIKFLQLIEDVIQIVKESVLSSELREVPLFATVSGQKELEKQLETILMTFHQVLNNLSLTQDHDKDEDSSPVVSQLIGTQISAKTSNTPTWEQRLLITLSNSIFTKTTILKQVQDKFKQSGFSNVEAPIRKAKIQLEEQLEKAILERYLEQKSDPLVGTIEPSMYLGRFDWDSCGVLQDLKPYAKECINNLIHIHAEVNSISPMLLKLILPQIVETIAEELYRLMSCVKNFNQFGAQQAKCDVRALQEFFQHFSTKNAENYFKEALDLIPELSVLDNMAVEDILKQCRVRMRIQYTCLYNTT